MDHLTTIHLQPAHPTQVTLAFIIAPIAGMVFGSLIISPIIFFILPISYVVAIIFGIPAYLLLRTLRWLNIWAFMLAGYVISVCGLSFFMFSLIHLTTHDDWLSLLIAPYHLITLFATLVFWCIAVKQTEIDITDQPPARNKSQIDPG